LNVITRHACEGLVAGQYTKGIVTHQPRNRTLESAGRDGRSDRKAREDGRGPFMSVLCRVDVVWDCGIDEKRPALT
jgi:hypothetical protein